MGDGKERGAGKVVQYMGRSRLDGGSASRSRGKDVHVTCYYVSREWCPTEGE
jgi:hypothetical protein